MRGEVEVGDIIKFQVNRNITNLYKSFLILLEDLEYEHQVLNSLIHWLQALSTIVKEKTGSSKVQPKKQLSSSNTMLAIDIWTAKGKLIYWLSSYEGYGGE